MAARPAVRCAGTSRAGAACPLPGAISAATHRVQYLASGAAASSTGEIRRPALLAPAEAPGRQPGERALGVG